MSRKYSSWASTQPSINSDFQMMRLATVMGNEQDQLKRIEKVESIPHMYINVDAPPPPSAMTRVDPRIAQPVMIPRQNSAYFAPPMAGTNAPTKVWPVEKPSFSESASSTSKRPHKHKHHHHHHHGSKHHHHRHHSRRHRAKSAESIRNRQHQTLLSPSKVMLANPQYIEQDQQQQLQLQQQQQQEQQQPMIVYREIPNGEGYTVDPNGFANVPYGMENETTVGDDQQAPVFVYQDANYQQQQQHQHQHQYQQPIATDGMSQQIFYPQDQETYMQQTDPFVCLPQQQQEQTSQVFYCTDPVHQDCLCTTSNTNMIQSCVSSPQQQFVCVDNTPTTIQPTIINQIPVFNPLTTTNTTAQSIVTVPHAPLQRTTSVLVQQPQTQLQPLQIIQQPQQLQVVQQPQQLQVIQQPQPLQIIQNPQIQSGQVLQLASAAPQVIQAQPVLQTIQMPTQAVAVTPQVLYQRPYDPVVVPLQNQQMAIANSPAMALSQPSYAPNRITSAAQPQGANMFRHALLRTVADRTGVPVPSSASGAGGVQLVQPSIVAPAASNQNIILAGGIQRTTSLPIIPLTPGGLLIPFQPAQQPGVGGPGPRLRTPGYPSVVRNFADIQQRIQLQRAQLAQALEQQNYSRIPSPPVLSAASRNLTAPYAAGTPFSGIPQNRTPFPPITSRAYAPGASIRPTYVQPSYIGSSGGSVLSGQSSPYRPLR